MIVWKTKWPIDYIYQKKKKKSFIFTFVSHSQQKQKSSVRWQIATALRAKQVVFLFLFKCTEIEIFLAFPFLMTYFGDGQLEKFPPHTFAHMFRMSI